MREIILMNKLNKIDKHGVYGSICPQHGASIGKHYRHTLDHFTHLFAGVLEHYSESDKQEERKCIIDYDTWLRGTSIESSINDAEELINTLLQ